ncbi:hypothetical protein H0H93_001625 [Arthromyces matolae]|nr:hypothetical protein H0H93_001625 [Arthromyces matolae]
MKTTLMQQVIAVAIFSVAMTRTFATPMPITDPRTDHVLLSLSTHGHDPHRNQLAAPIPAILQSAIDKVTRRFGELRLQLAPDITSTSELLQSTLAAHEIRTKLLSSANEFANLAIQGVSMSI